MGLLVFAYVLGSIPFSYVIARLFGGGDIRNVGSGNVGATNVLRSVGKLPGFIALLLDLLKGVAVILMARAIMMRPGWPFRFSNESAVHTQSFWIGLVALVAVLGHLYPVWLRFRGGKGVATAAGVFLAINPLSIAYLAIIFLIVALLSRYISLGSIVAAASLPLVLRFLTREPFWIVMFSIVIAVVVIVKHHSNIARIAGGSERKFPE